MVSRHIFGTHFPLHANTTSWAALPPARHLARMANLRAIDSLLQSLARWLKDSYAIARKPADEGGGGLAYLPAFSFDPVSSSELSREDFAADTTAGADRVSIYLYRVAVDPHLRTAGRPLSPEMRPAPLSLHLHLLFSLWSTNAAHDHLVLAWLLRQLHEHPILDSAALSADADWAPDEVVHLIPAELSNEDMMRLWDALTPSYRLSISYIARVVRIDPSTPAEGCPVVATRLGFGAWKDKEAAP